jgi:ABC-type multidrug transport system ATPase subunit
MPFRGTLPPVDGPRVLDVKNVSKRFGEKVVLDDVTFHVPVGEFLCLCGPNGAGKSSLLWSIRGLVEQDVGDSMIAGMPAERGR